MPQIIAAMDEDSKISRLMGCRIVGGILKVCGRQFDEIQLGKTYPGTYKSWGLGEMCLYCTVTIASPWDFLVVLFVTLRVLWSTGAFTVQAVRFTCRLTVAASNASTNTD